MTADGLDPAGPGLASMDRALREAGRAIAAGAELAPLLARLGQGPVPVDPEGVAATLFEAVPRGAALRPEDWLRLWPLVADRVGEVLDAVARAATAPRLAPRALRHLERLVVLAAPDPAMVVVGVTAGLDLEAGAPVGEVRVPPGVERLVVRLHQGGRRLGAVELPVLEAGRVTASQLRRAVAEDLDRSPDPARRAGGGAPGVPILMYHRIAADGPGDLAPYRVHPEAFEGQLDHLRRHGYRSITFAEWRAARARRRPLGGRPVLLSFDDGYRDFATEAFPLLRRYGFGASVFLVVDRVGQCSAWDARYGDTSPLMGWDEIRALAAQGIEFGSHTLRHDPQTGVPVAEVVESERTARRTLAAELGAAVTTVCYPYGDMDPVVRRAMQAVGHDVGVSCRDGVATVGDPPMALPRLDVPGSLDQAGFARLLDAAHRP